MIASKKYLKNKPICKVTFKVPPEEAPSAKTAHIVGDFNEWNEKASPMKKLKDGTFSLTLDLNKDKEYQFRYLFNRQVWENDWKADKYVPNPFGDGDNSVVIV